VTKASDNPFPSILIDESAEPSAPAAGHQRLYIDSTSFRLNATNSSGTQRELEYAAVATFSPTWTGSGGNPTVGNATLTGHWQKIADKLVWFCITLTYGSTSTTGTGTWNFGNFPFTVKSTSPGEQTVTCNVRDAGTTRFAGNANMTAGTTTTNICTIAENAGASRALSATSPITWATGDQVFIEGVVATD
jgi:hypothetical protein